MIDQYRFDDHDRKVIAALQALLWKVMTAVTINIGLRVQQEGVSGGSSLTLSVEPDLLNLECGESSYTEGYGSEGWTTMFWSASPGERTDNDSSWDESWLGEPYLDQSTINDLAECTLSIEDDDNHLLCDDNSDEEEDSDNRA